MSTNSLRHCHVLPGYRAVLTAAGEATAAGGSGRLVSGGRLPILSNLCMPLVDSVPAPWCKVSMHGTPLLGPSLSSKNCPRLKGQGIKGRSGSSAAILLGLVCKDKAQIHGVHDAFFDRMHRWTRV